jgi:hypothetical protein
MVEKKGFAAWLKKPWSKKPGSKVSPEGEAPVAASMGVFYRHKKREYTESFAPFRTPALGEKFSSIVVPLNYFRPDLDLSKNLKKVMGEGKLTADEFVGLLGVKSEADLPKALRDALEAKEKKRFFTITKGIKKVFTKEIKRGALSADELANILTHNELLKMIRTHQLRKAGVLKEGELPKKQLAELSTDLVDILGKIRSNRSSKNNNLALVAFGAGMTTFGVVSLAGTLGGKEFVDFTMPGEHSPIPHDSGAGGIGSEGTNLPPGGGGGIGGEGGAPSPGGEPAWHERAWDSIVSFFNRGPGRLQAGKLPYYGSGATGIGLTMAGAGIHGFSAAKKEYLQALDTTYNAIKTYKFENLLDPEIKDFYKHRHTLQGHFDVAKAGGNKTPIVFLLRELSMKEIEKTAEGKAWAKKYKKKFGSAKTVDVMSIHFYPVEMMGANPATSTAPVKAVKKLKK